MCIDPSDSESSHKSFVTWMRNTCSFGGGRISFSGDILAGERIAFQPKIGFWDRDRSHSVFLLLSPWRCSGCPFPPNDFSWGLWLFSLMYPQLCQKPFCRRDVLGDGVTGDAVPQYAPSSSGSRREPQLLSPGLTFSSLGGATPPTSTGHPNP